MSSAEGSWLLSSGPFQEACGSFLLTEDDSSMAVPAQEDTQVTPAPDPVHPGSLGLTMCSRKARTVKSDDPEIKSMLSY